MVKCKTIEFIESSRPVSGLVTKFGGQPTWLTGAQWPSSRSTGKPMRFIGQVAIEPELFGKLPAQMAYLFMTDEEDYVDGTWEPDGGENALVLQPGNVSCPTQALTKGPTLFRMVKSFFKKQLVPQPCEFAVKLNLRDEQELASDADKQGWSEEQEESYISALEGNKLGGTPLFIQADEFPGPGEWRLLLQLDSANVPFSVNFGDAGVGYGFISADGQQSKFLWQCA